MKGRKYLILILLFVLIFTSCKNEPEMDNNLLAGTIRILDRNIPFPFLLERTRESLRLIDYKNQIIDSTSQFRDHYGPMDTIKMREHEFLVLRSSPDLLLFDIRDSINFPYKNPLHAAQFVTTVESKEIELSSFLKNIQENTYRAEVESGHFATPNRDLKVIKRMNFLEDSVHTTFTYYYQDELMYAEKAGTTYHIFERKEKIFLSYDQRIETPQTLFQISNTDKNSFTLRTFRNSEEITERLKISEETQTASNIRTFARCMEGQPGEYYHDNLTFSKGNEYLIKKIGANAPEASGDGYITVHFTLNCKGEMGNPGLEQMDRNFQSTSFDPALVQHILTGVMNLKDWPEIKSGPFYKDIHSFLMFKIKDGKITDLCP